MSAAARGQGHSSLLPSLPKGPLIPPARALFPLFSAHMHAQVQQGGPPVFFIPPSSAFVDVEYHEEEEKEKKERGSSQ